MSLPTDAITIVAGVAFLAFAVWTWRGDTLDEEEVARARRSSRSAIAAACGAFFLAELGDKTMLATITLATTHDGAGGLFGVWLGSTIGMVAADALAILAGKLLGARLPERAVRIFATVAFVVFGLLLIAEGSGLI